MQWIPKIEYGLAPSVILFKMPPRGDPLNTVVDAEETTTRSFSGKVQTSWGHNRVSISPKFWLIPEDLKRQVDAFFIAWASQGKTFKYYPNFDKPEFYVVISRSRTIDPKIQAIQGADAFFWEFDLPMDLVDPGTYAVAGAPVTSVNTRIGNVFVREIYNTAETDIIAEGTNTGLEAQIIRVADPTILVPITGKIAFDTTNNEFAGVNNELQWQTIGGGAFVPYPLETIADGGIISSVANRGLQNRPISSATDITLAPAIFGTTVGWRDATVISIINKGLFNITILDGSLIQYGIVTDRPIILKPEKALLFILEDVSKRFYPIGGVSGVTSSTGIIVGNAQDVINGIADYSTISSAITAAGNGDTINLLPRTFTEDISTVKRLRFIGSGSDTIINGTFILDIGSSNSLVKDIWFDGNITIKLGVTGVYIIDSWIDFLKTVTQEGAATDNLYLLWKENV